MERNNSVIHQACAACKHQRKKCNVDCILAPYFPADKTREFQAVHRVFGVANVAKLIKNVKEEDRKRTADTLIWEALCRQKDPILGSYGEYTQLFQELKSMKSQNQLAQQQILGMQRAFLAFKRAPSFLGCNGSNGTNISVGMMNNDEIIESNALNYVDNKGNSSSFGYPYHLQSPQGWKQERDVGFMAAAPHSINGFNEQFYVQGQFTPTMG